MRAYRASNQTAYRFSQEHGVALSSLSRWTAEEGAQTEESAAFDFVRLEVAREAAPRSLIVEVGVARVQVERGFDAELLREVIGALGSRQ